MTVIVIWADDEARVDLGTTELEGMRAAQVVLHVICAADGGRDTSPAGVDRPVAVSDHTWPEHLTSRELEVLQLLAEGLANKQIACRLCISEKTVKSHISTMLNKFGLQSRTQVAMEAVRLGLVRTDLGRLGPWSQAASSTGCH